MTRCWIVGLLAGDIAVGFLTTGLAQSRVEALLSNEHFSVDGTLIEAWASMKSFRPKDGSGTPLGAGETASGTSTAHRSNDTHASTTDPDAPLCRKGSGKEAKLCFMRH